MSNGILDQIGHIIEVEFPPDTFPYRCHCLRNKLFFLVPGKEQYLDMRVNLLDFPGRFRSPEVGLGNMGYDHVGTDFFQESQQLFDLVEHPPIISTATMRKAMAFPISFFSSHTLVNKIFQV
jgi:hypothetical protein